MKSDWNTWSPFQSPEVRDICAHMTTSEKTRATIRSGLYGIWVAATFALPVAFAIAYGSVVVAAGLMIVHIACIPLWRRMQRHFLCSTAWARQSGIRPDQIRMFAWRT